MGDESGNAIRRKSLALDAVLAGEALQEMVRQQLHIPRAFAKRRHLDREDIQAVVKILAEIAFLDGLQEIAVRRRQHAHIDFDRLVAPHPFKLPLLEDAEQLGLQGERDFADLIKQDRPAVGQLETPIALVGRAGEGSLLMTEKLALDECLGNGGAVDLDERFVETLAVEENFVRDEFLAGAVLAGNHHRRVGAADPLDQILQAKNRRAFSDDLAPGDAVAVQKIGHLHRALELGGFFHHQIDLGHGKRLRHIIEGPRTHALDHGFHAAIRRDHHHQRLGLAVGHSFYENPPITIGQFHIEENQIESVAGKSFLGFSDRAGCGHGESLATQAFFKGFANDRGVIHHQYAV